MPLVRYKVTLDTQEDYELLDWIFKVGREYQLELTCGQVISLIDTYPDVYMKVAMVQRKNYDVAITEWYAEHPRTEAVDIPVPVQPPVNELPKEPPKKRGRKPKQIVPEPVQPTQPEPVGVIENHDGIRI